ncbi:MAG: hypothetical protein ABIU10_10285 [Sphingomicrobium sp.]
MKSGLKRAWQTLLRLYPMGVSLLWKAPLVLALVIFPEFVQHVAEIQLGMFGSKAQSIAAADHPTRMIFGYIKIAGLVLTFLAAARFWAARKRRTRWYRLSDIAWGRFALGFLVFGLLPAVPALFAAQLGKASTDIIGIVVTIILLPALFLMLAGLFGDRATPIRAMWLGSWPWAVLTALLLVLAFMPAQWLHGMNHRWAFGAEPVLVWVLMTFDSVLVGLLAGLTGTALYLGYAAFRDTVTATKTADVTSSNANQDRLSTGA